MKRIITFIITIAMLAGMLAALKTDPVQAASKKPGKPSVTLSAGTDNKSITVSIAKTKNAEGYLIYMKAETDSKFKKVKTLKKDGTAVRTCTIKDLAEGKYSFKVRAYLKQGSKTVKGKYGQTATLLLKVQSADGKLPIYPELEFDVSHVALGGNTETYTEVKLDKTYGGNGGGISFSTGEKIRIGAGTGQDFTAMLSKYIVTQEEYDAGVKVRNDNYAVPYDMEYYTMRLNACDWTTYNELNIVPTMSSFNTKGLEEGKTLLGTDTVEEAEAIVDAWLKAGNSDTKNVNFNTKSYDASSYGVLDIYFNTDADDEKAIVFGEWGSSSGWGRETLTVDTEKFDRPVYKLTGVYFMNPSYTDDAIGWVDYAGRYTEILSLITSTPYDLVRSISGDDKTESLGAYYGGWIRVNDTLFYREKTSSGSVYYFAPASYCE